MTAKDIVDRCFLGWGDRESYPINEEEFRILKDSGGDIIITNKDHGDGTFFHSISFSGKKFSCSSTTRV